MVSGFVVAFALLAAQAQGPPAGSVRGVVRSESNAAPLKYAIVEVVGGDLRQRAVTDSSGVYVLRNVPTGLHAIRATHLDHHALEVHVIVPTGAEVHLDLSLGLNPVALPPVLARTRQQRGSDTIAASAPDLGAAAVKALEASPGVAELGLGSNRGGTPGSDPADPSDVLYVRGAAADLKLVLLDGAPVYAPFHVGGLINAFDPDVLSSATLYLGGAPARYDGGVSYVMDMQTRGGRRDGIRSRGSADLLSSRALVEGPITSHAGYMLAGRAVHGWGARQLLNDPFPYTYGDALARLDYDLGAHGALRATAFWNDESVRLSREENRLDEASWGNIATSVRYKGLLAGAEADVTAGFGSFEATLPVGGENPLTANGLSQRLRVAADLGHGIGPVQVHYGASYDHTALRYLSRPRSADVGQDVFNHITTANGDVGGVYFDAAAQAGPRLRLRAGVRGDLFSRGLDFRVGPRLAATLLLTDRAALTFAAGQYHQYVRASEAQVVDVDPLAEADSGAVQPLSVARASHVLVALDQDMGEGIRLGLQGFFKQYEGLPHVEGEGSGRNDASGVDLWVRRSAGRLTGWIGYSLGWVWSVNNPAGVRDHFSGRQLVSAGMTAPLGTRGRVDLRVSYGAGLPYTAIPEGDVAKPAFAGSPVADVVPNDNPPPQTPLTPAPDDPYLRVDAEIARTFATQWWSFAFEVTPYVRVINALDRRDALFYHFDRASDNEPRALAALPVLPVIGFEWRF